MYNEIVSGQVSDGGHVYVHRVSRTDACLVRREDARDYDRTSRIRSCVVEDLIKRV